MDSSMSETTFLSSTTSSQQDDPQNSYNQSALVPSAHERYESGRAIEADMGADDRQVLLAITVEIHDGHTGTISVHEGDSAEDVATKFCKDHAISEQYITPLTEHIVRELHISGLDDKILDHGTTISKADEGRPQSSKGESRGEDLSPNSVSQRNKRTHSLFERTNPKLCNHKLCSLKTLMQQELPKVKTRKPTGHHVLPSFASLAKSQKVESLLEKKLEAQRSSQLSPKSKAVYTRLYVEFLKQKQRMEEERKACLEQYHERLERDKPTYTKRTKWIMSIRGRAAKQFKNYGELLYREGLNKGVERKRLAEQKQLEDECHELESITAKPEISKYAKQIKRPHKFWERLSTDDSKHHLRELQNESLEMKLMECTFRPRINKNFFLDQEANSSNRFNQLFWDAESRRRRQAEYMQWYPEGVTFRPMINPHWASGSALYSGKGKGNVFNRLLQYASKLADKKQKWQDNEQKPVDPTTGKELFRPQTGRKPYLERNTDAVPIGDFLYQLKFALDKKKHALMDRNIQKAKELANCQYVSSNSSKILESIKSRSIQEIFDYLDVDQDGYIDPTNADTKDLSDEVMADLEYVKELGTGFEKQLSFEKFSTLMIEIQKKKKHGLHSVFRHCKKHQEIEKLPFNLKLDERSCQLASGRRKPGDRQHWYQLILSDWEKQQAKVEALRKEKENQELAECTFKPSLHKNDCRKPARFIHGGPINGTLSSPQSTVVEKEQQEIHGFIFQEAKMGGHGSVGIEASSPNGLLKTLTSILTSRQSDRREQRLSSRSNNLYLSDVPEV